MANQKRGFCRTFAATFEPYLLMDVTFDETSFDTRGRPRSVFGRTCPDGGPLAVCGAKDSDRGSKSASDVNRSLASGEARACLVLPPSSVVTLLAAVRQW